MQTQVNRQASVAEIVFAGFFGIFSSSIEKILLYAKISEYKRNYQQNQHIRHSTTQNNSYTHRTITFTLFIEPSPSAKNNTKILKCTVRSSTYSSK